MRIVCSYRNTDIKINSFATAKQFLDEVLLPNNEYHIRVNAAYSIHFYTNRGKDLFVTQRFGDHNNIFNPEIAVYGEEIVKAVFHARKAINNYFFNDEV